MPPPAPIFWKKVDENQVSYFIWPDLDVSAAVVGDIKSGKYRFGMSQSQSLLLIFNLLLILKCLCPPK